jgi:Ca2+-transporting ATPase
MTHNGELNGLTSAEAAKRLEQYGHNVLAREKKQSFFSKALHVILEPMFVLLIVAAVIYFILGEARDGAIMLIFVVGIISIDVVQEWKTGKTLEALRDLSAPQVAVIRDGRETTIPSAGLVAGDGLIVREGDKVAAEGVVLRCSDLRVDESALTGEAEGVWKVCEGEAEKTGDYWRRDYCYAGTLVTQGTGAVRVEKTGASTEYGKIGASVAAAREEPTPLQKQTGKLVKMCAGIAAVLFALVGALTYLNLPDHLPGERVVESILSGITLAMAMIPEEFPVILTVFLSMGAWRLAKKNSLVRRLPSVETLGAISVLCVDKTGTITMNQMKVTETWACSGDEDELCEIMGLGCETDTYDPMEKAMLEYCEVRGIRQTHIFGGELLSEYAFTNELKMMGHVWRHEGEVLIAAKGSPEKLLTLCTLTADQRAEAEGNIRAMSQKGLRVIAVGIQKLNGEDDIPEKLTDCRLTLLGLVGLCDPPRPGVKADIASCTRAGIRVMMITGDNGTTASAIARQVGIPHAENVITGDMLETMSDEELRACVKTASVCSRVIPEHKMRIVRALRDNGEIVAMTGDGVNDAPALKHADIGIAMGKRGSEVSREAADLILMDDNFSTIVDTVRDARRIYDNIRKAVGYVFAIHIPIALASLLGPLLKIAPSELLLLPLHVVLLELLIDPTCSIVLERQAAEADIMQRPPRGRDEKLLDGHTLTRSILQGLMLFIAAFGAYYFTLISGAAAETARAMGLAVLMLSNLLLVQVNASCHTSVVHTARILLHDKVMWAVNLGTLMLLIVILYTPLSTVLKLSALSGAQLIIVLALSFAAVFWYEIVKAFSRHKARLQKKNT